MASQQETLEQALGDLYLIVDWWPTWQNLQRKLPDLSPGSDEAFYFLATNFFVLAIKTQYMCKILRPFLEQSDPALARDLKDNWDAILAGGNWAERAATAEAAFIRLFREFGLPHGQDLEGRAGSEGQ